MCFNAQKNLYRHRLGKSQHLKVQLCLDDTFQVELESYLVSKSLLLAYFYSEHSSTQWMNSIMSWTDANHCH